MPKKSTREKSHPQCAAVAREAVDAVRAEKDREIERLREAVEVLRQALTVSAYGYHSLSGYRSGHKVGHWENCDSPSCTAVQRDLAQATTLG